ncbi:hypothetical protein ES703_101952 [subsurface metagenome]
MVSFIVLALPMASDTARLNSLAVNGLAKKAHTPTGKEQATEPTVSSSTIIRVGTPADEGTPSASGTPASTMTRS